MDIEELIKEGSATTAGLQNILEMIGPAAIGLGTSIAGSKTLSAIGKARFGPAGGVLAAPLAGMIAGIAASAVMKGAGAAAKMHVRSELEAVFNEIMRQNPDLARNRVQSRQFFDVIARHSPGVAADPVMAAGLIRNMEAFGGVSLDTVKQLAEIEDKKRTFNFR